MKKRILTTALISMFISISFANAVFADWYKVDDKYKYYNSAAGQYVTNNWLQTGNGFYYFDSSGYAVTGWYLINGNYYYFGENGLMQTGFVEYDGKKYYLNMQNGQMVTGWIQTYNDGVLDYYYFGENGVMLTGWNKIGNSWFYFNEGKCLVNTFAAVNGIWYHFGVNGAMDIGWVNANGRMFYFNTTNGSLTKGWIQDQNGNEYYLSEIDGSLTVNTTMQIGGIFYTFDSQGKCIGKDTTNYGTINSVNGYLGYGIRETVQGVNVGVSPGSSALSIGDTSAQQIQQQNQAMEAGQTAGPK